MTMWERRAELEGFAAVIEGVRNAAPGLKGRAISGPHDYRADSCACRTRKLRVANFYSDFDSRLAEVPFVGGVTFSVADITTFVIVDFATRSLGMPVQRRAAR